MENFSANVQYGDLKGGVSIDEGDLKGLHDFAQNNGINVQQYFPIGVSFYIGENGFVSTIIITIDVVTHSIPGNYDNIKDFIEQNNPVPVVKFDISKSFEDFLQYIKRVNIVFKVEILDFMGKISWS
jgi:hypothetical protein